MNDRELDALVAEKVMGWTVLIPPADPTEDDDLTRVAVLDPSYLGLRRYIETRPQYWALKEWHPSTDITAAMTIVQHMHSGPVGPGFHLDWTPADGPDEAWLASFGSNNYPERGEHIVEAVAPTPERAICLAALQALAH